MLYIVILRFVYKKFNKQKRKIINDETEGWQISLFLMCLPVSSAKGDTGD